MKTLSFIILAVFSTYSLSSQKYAVPQAELKSLDGNLIASAEIIDPATETLVVLWGHIKSEDHVDLETIQSAWINNLKPTGVKMVVICAGNIVPKTQLKELAKERNWEFEVYFDYYGEFKSSIISTNIPAILFYGKGQTLICHNHINCAGKINVICQNILENQGNIPEMTFRKFDSANKHCHTPPSCNSRSW